MCDPITLGVTALAFAAVGAGVNAYATYQAQSAANAAAEYNAKVAERNKQIADMQAERAEQQGEIDAKQHRLKVAGMIGEQRSDLAGSGVVVDEGSALDVIQDTAEWGELDALTIRNNAAVDAWGYRTQGLNYQAQADASRMSKRSAGGAAGMSLLSDTTKIGSQFALTGATMTAKP